MAHFVHDDKFVESFANAPHRVLGVRLRPYSLWHQFNLEISQSALLLGTPLTPLDLWRAVRICSSSWNPAYQTPDLTPPSTLRWIWQVGRFNFRDEVKKFEAYYADFVAPPKFWPNNHKGKTGGGDRDIDEILEVACHLELKGGRPSEEVWNMPVGVAKWRSAVYSKLEGADILFWTPLDEEAFKKHKEKREARIDARGKEIAEQTGLPFAEARQRAHDEHWAKVKRNYGNQSRQP